MVELPKRVLKIRVKDLPWDILRLVLGFFNQQEFQSLKFIDRQLRKLVL